MTGRRPDAPSSWMTATSALGSTPTTWAVNDRPVPTETALILVAPSMTWLLVSTRPLAVRTMPVPAAMACW